MHAQYAQMKAIKHKYIVHCKEISTTRK